jgi:type IV pilus assembly protein PilB
MMATEEMGRGWDDVIAYLKDELAGEELAGFEERLARDADLRSEVERSRDVLDLLEAASERRILQVVDTMVVEAVRRGASDIHLVPDRAGLKVYLREDGALVELPLPEQLPEDGRIPRTLRQAVVDRWKLMCGCDLRERQRPQSGTVPFAHEGTEYNLRVGVMPTLYGERVTIGIFQRGSLLLGLERLGASPAQAAAIRRLCRLPNGFVAIVGPSGTGKTTVLYSMLLELLSPDRPRANLMTIEDPVEFAIEGVSQVSVNRSAGLTFASTLREIFRVSDPDAIAVWELPDRETSELAFHVAVAGHLILAQETLNSAAGIIRYLREQALDPYLVARSFAGSVGVRLVRKICEQCAAPYEPAAESLERLGLSTDEATFRRGAGCAECRGTGYRRRAGLFEVLEADEPFRRLVAREAPPEELWQAAFGAGGSLWDDSREKVRAGITTVEEIERVMGDYPHPPARQAS